MGWGWREELWFRFFFWGWLLIFLYLFFFVSYEEGKRFEDGLGIDLKKNWRLGEELYWL